MTVHTETNTPAVATAVPQALRTSHPNRVDPDFDTRLRECSTLVDMLRLRAEELPDQLLITFLGDDDEPDQPTTAGELDRLARRVAALLQSLNAANQRVLLAMQPGRLYCAAFLGCLYARATAVPVYPPISPALAERVQTIAKDCGATLVLTDKLINAIGAGLHLYAPELRSLRWIEMEDLAPESENAWIDPQVGPDDLAFLQYTSGTTADPKGVMITHGNLTANLKTLSDVGSKGLGIGEPDLNRGFSWLPPFHDMGLTGMLFPVMQGTHLVTVSPMHFIRRPERWLREMSKWGSNISGGPNFAYELLIERASQLADEPLDLSQWKVAISGAEPVRSSTLDRFCATFEPYGFKRESFCPSYGMAEATLYISSASDYSVPLICHVDREALSRGEIVVRERADASTLDFVGCGPAGGDLTVVIADTTTMMEAGPGKVGEIWAKGSNIGQGYWGKPELTRERFAGTLTSARAGLPLGPYFRTGDHGFWYGEQLFFVGRIAEILRVRGRTFYPADLEHTAAQTCDLLTTRGGAAFTVGEGDETRVVLVHEIDERSVHAVDIAPAIVQATFREHAVTVSEVVLIRRNALLRTSSGKPRRRSVRAAFLEGSLKIASSWRMA